ncbi:MAG: hypothetical protein ABI221_03525 [Candidatus Saccharimonadales bacterium]
MPQNTPHSSAKNWARDYQNWVEQFDYPWFIQAAWATGVVLLLLAGWLWWSYGSVKSYDVFWGTINNSLATNAVSKQVSSSSGGTTIALSQQISLGGQNAVTSRSVITQGQGDQQTVVKTESIATPTTNYSRYTNITTRQSKAAAVLNFKPILNIWGKEAVNASGNGSFAQAIFDIIPIADLQPAQRQAVVASMKTGNVYTVDYSAVKKHHQNGHLIYDYTLAIAPDGYVNILKQIDNDMNLNQLTNLDASQYQGAVAVKVTVSIDAHARQLVGLSFDGSNQTESFSNYGYAPTIQIPAKTVPLSQLQNQLAATLGSK